MTESLLIAVVGGIIIGLILSALVRHYSAKTDITASMIDSAATKLVQVALAHEAQTKATAQTAIVESQKRSLAVQNALAALVQPGVPQ